MTAMDPALLAAVDRRIAAVKASLDTLIGMWPDALARHGGRSQTIAAFARHAHDVYTPDLLAKLLAVAVAELAERGTAVDDLPPVDLAPAWVPAGRHGVATITDTHGGPWLWVCVCSAAAYADTEDEAVSALDAHIADPAAPVKAGA